MISPSRHTQRLHLGHLYVLATVIVVMMPVSPHLKAEEALFELSLESLLHIEVNSASKKSERIYQAPAIIAAITRQDIARYGALNLRDALARLPGLLLLSDADFQYDNFSVRGEPLNFNNHLLLLINGHPFRSTPSASDVIRRLLSSFPVDLVERIEFIRGPGSALYGANAFTGVINIITREAAKGDADTHPLETKVVIGANRTRKVNVTGFNNWQEDGFNVSASVDYFESHGWRAEFLDVNNQPASKQRGSDYRSIALSGDYQGFDFSFFSANRDADLLDQRVSVEVPNIKDEHHFTSLGYHHDFSEHTHLSTNLSYLASDISEVTFKNREYLVELDLRHEFESELELLIGMSALNVDFESDQLSLQNFNTESYGLYLQLLWQFNESTQVIVGGQANNAKSQNTHYVPRLGLSHQFNEHWGAKLLYSEAFRSPNALESKVYFPGVLTGTEGLMPETVETYELEAFFHDDHFYASLAAYHSYQKDLIGLTFDTSLGYNRYSNSSEREFFGFEHSFNYKLSEHFSIEGSANWQRNKKLGFTQAHDTTTLPRWFAKLGLSYEQAAWNVGLWDTYVDDFRITQRFESSKLNINPPAQAYHNVSLNLTWRPYHASYDPHLKSMQLALLVQNLLDQEIRQNSLTPTTAINTFPSDTDRAAFISLSLNF